MEDKELDLEKNMSDDFKDVEEKNKYKNYIIIGVLYFFVVILTVLLVFGLRHQKNTVIDNMDSSNKYSVNIQLYNDLNNKG